MSVELSKCVPKLPARLLLRQDHHALEVDRQAEAEYGLDKDADRLKRINPQNASSVILSDISISNI